MIAPDRSPWVAIVTGAGRGLGAAHARQLARNGTAVVVNDLGCSPSGEGSDPAVAESVAASIRAEGGSAVACALDTSDDDQAHELVVSTVSRFGRLDAVVNNAGGVVDRMFVSMTPDDWDRSLRMNLRSHFCVSRHAAAWWRERSRRTGHAVPARIVNTTSGAGLFGSVGQTNYVAAKAAVAAMTVNLAAELGRYGVTVNAVAPIARTRLTESLFAEMMAPTAGEPDLMHPRNVAPVVAWLAGPQSGDVTGRIFEVGAGQVTILDGWQRDGSTSLSGDLSSTSTGDAVRALVLTARGQEPVYGA